MLGGAPTAIGTEPFTYEWSINETIESLDLHASYFLNDTTIPNPYLYPEKDIDSIRFYLKVTEESGEECFDSVLIRFSSVAYTLGNRDAYIALNDSAQLYPGFEGGIEPLSFSWTPEDYLSNPNEEKPYASPPSDRSYSATMTDSAGCVFKDIDFFNVHVSTNHLEEIIYQDDMFSIYPNPTSQNVKIKMDTPNENSLVRYKVLDVTGKTVLEGTLENNTIGISTLNAGYYSVIIELNQQFYAKPLVVE